MASVISESASTEDKEPGNIHIWVAWATEFYFFSYHNFCLLNLCQSANWLINPLSWLYLWFVFMSVLQPAVVHVFAVYLYRPAAVVISGTELARQLHREIQRDVEELVAQGNMRPHLGVVIVGDDPASRTYVRNKTRAASILGQKWALCIMRFIQINDYNIDLPDAFHSLRHAWRYTWTMNECSVEMIN